MIAKHTRFYIVLFLIFFILLVLYIFLNSAPNLSQQNQPTQLTPTPTFFPEGNNTDNETKNQGEIDLFFNNELNDIFSAYPWYKNLPLTNINYYVSFNLIEKQFDGVVFQKPNNLSEEQIELIKIEAFSKLEALGIPRGSYPVVWNIIY